MKKLMMILMMFVAVGVSGQNVVNNATQWNLNDFVLNCLKDSKIDSVLIVIQPCKGLIFGKYRAVSYGNDNLYFIQISKYMDYESTLIAVAHEIIHIRQLLKKELVLIDSENIVFNGVKYHVTENSHWDDKHELQAVKEGNKLFDKYKFIL